MSNLYKLAEVEKLTISYLRSVTHIPESEEQNFLDDLKDILEITDQETGCEICGTTPDETCKHTLTQEE